MKWHGGNDEIRIPSRSSHEGLDSRERSQEGTHQPLRLLRRFRESRGDTNDIKVGRSRESLSVWKKGVEAGIFALDCGFHFPAFMRLRLCN